jgi:SAM-dependent methyltransferase
VIDRDAWLAEQRAAVEADYTRDAPTYDDGYDPVTAAHLTFVERLISTVPEGGRLLDAACGTAPYAGIALDAGIKYVGIDQSNGMLDRARVKWPAASFERMGLQELAPSEPSHAVMCIDAMEHVPPEQWPDVLARFRKALKPGGYLYITVEEIDRSTLIAALEAASSSGLPAVFGEDLGELTGGYHFYPDRNQVAAWARDAGFEMVAEDGEWFDDYGYHHLFMRVPT